MTDFSLYFSVGVQHIANINGLDHILFIAALCIRYQFSNWRQLLVLVTAFTIGHSLTLALSVFNIVRFSTAWIEFIIPLTIVVTAVSNLFAKKTATGSFPFIYYLALVFGLVHGLGFSNYLKSMLGRSERIFTKLLAFNLGLEAGQLLILAVILTLSFVCLSLLKINRREYIVFLSGGIIAIALQMTLQRIPF